VKDRSANLALHNPGLAASAKQRVATAVIKHREEDATTKAREAVLVLNPQETEVERNG
jgi:hypothetical protein